MSGWEVRVEGDPSHDHEPEFSTLTCYPPISQVACRGCGRMLWQRQEVYHEPWPDESGARYVAPTALGSWNSTPYTVTVSNGRSVGTGQ